MRLLWGCHEIHYQLLPSYGPQQMMKFKQVSCTNESPGKLLDMDDNKLRMILAELNDQLTGGEARSQITIAKPAGYVCLTANKHGLVSFARTFLTAALLPESDHDSASNLSTLDRSHVQIVRSDEELALGWIEHAHEVPMSEENIAAVRRQAWRNDRFFLLGCGLIGFVMMFLMTTGIATWIAIINGRRVPF